MAIIENADEVEIGPLISQSQGQPQPPSPTEDTAQSESRVTDTSGTTTSNRLSTSESMVDISEMPLYTNALSPAIVLLSAISDLKHAGESYHRFNDTGNVEVITNAIGRLESVASSVAVPIYFTYSMLGGGYMLLFECTANIEDINRAISYNQKAVESTPSEDANLPTFCTNLGNSYVCRFERTGDIKDINSALSHLQKAFESAPAGHPDLPGWFNNLGNSYVHRFKRTGDLNDINLALSHHQKAVESAPPGHVDLPDWFNNIGNSYSRRFERTEDLNDIELAISYHQKAVNSNFSGHADLPGWYNDLGNSYLRRFECTEDLKDIDSAISYLQKGIDSTPFGHADLPRWFNNLGNSHLHRFERTEDLNDLNSAISHLQKGVDSTPSSNTNLLRWINNLANLYTSRFKRTGNLDDINSAISHLQRAMESAPSGHADLSRWINHLGISYSLRFKRTGDLKDINSAISHFQKAIEFTPSSHANLPSWINNLGLSYLYRFERTGDLNDIDSAISFHQKAVESTPSGHAGLPSWLNNLGNSYLRRFEHTLDLKDINSAISHHQNAVESTSSGPSNLSTLFNNLGNSYLGRFKYTEDLKDIDFAISYHQKAIESAPSGPADLPTLFNSLGNSYLYRFERSGDLNDIDSAISHHHKAVESTPSGHADLPKLFNSLGNSYSRRFKHTGYLKDIDSAISHHQKAVDSTPSGHADLPGRLNNLGNSYSGRFEHSQYLPDIKNSIVSYRHGAASNGAPSTRLRSAKLAAMHSSVHDHFNCLTDFSLAVTLLSEVAGLEQTVHRRHANLLHHSDFLGRATAFALKLGQPDFALNWLEQGRCLVWNQINQLRAPVYTLHIKHSFLANRFMDVANALESHGTRSIPSLQGTLAEEIHIQDDTLNHTRLAGDYKQLLEEIRSLPEFNDFLRPPKADNLLSSLPSDGPVIVFNISKVQCDALALIAGLTEPIHIPLEHFSFVEAETMNHALQVGLLKQQEFEDRDRGMRLVTESWESMSGILQALWEKVVQPILEALGYSSQPDHSARGRIWWCPTGPLAFLPLHAAGIYGPSYKPGLRISDFAVSSYTPTVQSLNQKAATSCPTRKYTDVLLINPNTPSLPAIPFTRKEIQDLKVILNIPHIRTLVLEDKEATTGKVKDGMNTCGWVHLACHGIQDTKDPLKSGVHLYDGRLELLEIMRQKIPNPELAFLSACQTSKGDLKLTEEVVHLAAGMLAVGYRGVVGTMWSISDRHGPEFAKWFYEYLLENMGTDGLDSKKAAYALDYATRKVRESLGAGDEAFLTWVPYVHFGY